MAIIPHSQLELSRARRAMEKAMNANDWQSVGNIDGELDVVMEKATSDSERDLGSLLTEMAHLLKFYKQLMKTCHEQGSRLASEQTNRK